MNILTREKFLTKLRETIEGQRYLEFVLNSERRSRSVTRERGYELHHIQPRALGGTNELENLIKLTTYEHCEAHLLLAKALPCYETLYPITKLCGKQIKELTDLERVTLEELYEFSKVRYDALHCKKPEHQRQKIAEANRKKAKDPEFRKLLQKPKSEITKLRLRKPKSVEHRQKLARKNQEKGEEYQKQKEEYVKTGKAGPLLKSMLQRSEKAKQLNDRKRKVFEAPEFIEWYETSCFGSTGRRLNRVVGVSKFLQETGRTLDDYS